MIRSVFINIKKVYKYAINYRKYLFIYLLFVPFISAISVLIPLFLAKEIVFVNDALYNELLKMALIILLVEIFNQAAEYISRMSLLIYFRKTMRMLKIKVLKSVMHIKNKDLDELSTGAIIERINSDCNNMAEIIPNLVDNLIGILSNIGILLAIFIINKILFVYLLSGAIIIFIFKNMSIKYMYEYEKRSRKQRDKVTSFITELVKGIRDIKVLNANTSFINETEKRILEHDKIVYTGRKVQNGYSFLTEVIYSLINFIFIVLSIVLIKNNYLSLPGFIALFYYIERIYSMFNFYTHLQEDFKDFDLSCKRVFEVIEGNTFEKERFGSKEIKKIKGNFEFRNVNFAYKEKVPVLKDVSFKVKANTTVAFVGKSGAGKTTIFGLLAKLYEANSGDILIDNININDLTEKAIRSNMTIINQSPYIFNMSIYDNMKLVSPKASKKDIINACKAACLDDFIESLPDKYDTVVGEGGILLSGGQKQRLAIARALVQKTKIILFDEATSALDNETQKSIQDAINNMQGDFTILIIAHRFSTVINSDKIIYIDDGKIIAEGTHDELLKTCKGYKKLYELELKNNV